MNNTTGQGKLVTCEDIILKPDDDLVQNLLFTSLDDEVSNEWKLNISDDNGEPSDGESYPVVGSDKNIHTNQTQELEEEKIAE